MRIVLARAIALALGTVAAAGLAGAQSPLGPPQPRTGPDFSDVQSGVPAWSPDGKQIAFVSSRSSSRSYSIFVMNADGSRARRLVEGYSPAWSPDGRELAYGMFDGEVGYLAVVRADGTGSRRLVRSGREQGPAPDWSPDGRRIAFDMKGGISIVNTDGTGLRTILTGGSQPDWSPDGGRIVFRGTDDRGGFIEVAHADGTGRTRLLGPRVSQPRWSPDGKLIALVDHGRGSHPTIHVMNADGSALTPLTGRKWNEDSPSWAPDGSRIAFAAADPPDYDPWFPRWPKQEIYTAGLADRALVRLTFGGCTIVGTDGSDVLVGTRADDVICGFGGNDLIRGGSGEDKLAGGAGDDTIYGEAGADRVSGEEGADTLDGGPGADSIRGGLGNDRIRSRSSEQDRVDGEPGLDTADADRRDVLVDVERGSGGTRTHRPTLAEIRATARRATAESRATFVTLEVDAPVFSFELVLRVRDPAAYLENRFNTVVHAMSALEPRAWKFGTEAYRVYGPSGLVFAYKGTHGAGRGWTASYCVAEGLSGSLYLIDLFFGEIEGEGGPSSCSGWKPSK